MTMMIDIDVDDDDYGQVMRFTIMLTGIMI
jgi:hypothetical protein